MKNAQPVNIDQERYWYLSPHQSHQLAFKLACQIGDKIEAGELKKPDVIIGIDRGALAWVKTIADWLNVDLIYTFRIKHYTSVAKRLDKPFIIQSHLPELRNHRVLLFDNVLETGKTMQLALNHLEMFGCDEITTVSLFYKSTSKLKPDFHIQNTDAWIIFYFDIMETIKLLGSHWLSHGLDLATINQRFLKIGLPQEEVTRAMKLVFKFEPPIPEP